MDNLINIKSFQEKQQVIAEVMKQLLNLYNSKFVFAKDFRLGWES